MEKGKIHVIIVDDETHSRKRILKLLDSYNNVNVMAECGTGRDAIKSINVMRPDIIFLDIRLKDMTGFDVLKALDAAIGPLVIFVTAFDEYAIKAFDFFAFDYLLKPFEDERLHKSLERVIAELNQRKETSFRSKLSELLNYVEDKKSSPPGYSDLKLPVRKGSKIEFVAQDSIKYITASGYYVDIHTIDKKYLLRESLTNLLGKLKQDFIRIHRSTIISIHFIKELEYTLHGDIEVIMEDKQRFKVSKSYKKSFQLRFDL